MSQLSLVVMLLLLLPSLALDLCVCVGRRKFAGPSERLEPFASRDLLTGTTKSGRRELWRARDKALSN